MAGARGYGWSELGLVEKNGKIARTWMEEEMRGGGTASWGLWLKATSFLCNRSSVHVIRQGGVGAGGSWQRFLFLFLLHLIHG